MYLFTRLKQLLSRSPKEDGNHDLELQLLEPELKPSLRRILRLPTKKTMAADKIQETGEHNARSDKKTRIAKINVGKLEESLPRFGPCYGRDQPSMLDSKNKSFEHVFRKTLPDNPSKAREDCFLSMRRVEQEAKSLYGEKMECSHSEFRQMMARDGCFFLQLALLMIGNPEQLGYPPNDLIFGKSPNKNDAKKWIESMFFAGNQIPLVVLKQLLALDFFRHLIVNGRWDPPTRSTMCKKVLYDLLVLQRESTEQGRGEQPSDVLHGLYNAILGPGPLKRKSSIQELDYNNIDLEAGQRSTDDDSLDPGRHANAIDDNSNRRDFLSATELSELGICIRKLKSGGLRSTSFVSYYFCAVLYLPAFPIHIDDDVEMIFKTLMSYEARHESENHNNGEVSSYIRFMSDIIRTPGDVKLLQRKGMFQVPRHYHDYDDELPEMLTRLSNKETPLTHDFRILKRKIRDYSAPPWSQIKNILNVMALLTLVQTIFTILSYQHRH